MKIYLQKNTFRTEENNQPHLNISAIIGEGDSVKFIRIGGLWKSKSGKGFSGKLDDDKIKELIGDSDELTASVEKADKDFDDF